MSSADADIRPGAERFVLQAAEGAIAGWRWPKPGAPQLVFLHATGFCARAYAAMLAAAREELDILALDLRGHGRTQLPADPQALRSWDVYARDLSAALDALPAIAGGRILAGHSCGAVVATLAAAVRSDVADLALIEPVATPRWMSLAARSPVWPRVSNRWPLVRGARARRAVFPSRVAAEESYGRKAFFARWREGVLADYLEDGLVEIDGGVRLSCDPAWEAATFAAQAHDFWGAVRRARVPVNVLIARDPSSTVSRGAEGALRRLGARISARSDASHLLPFEIPQQAATFLVNAAKRGPETR